MTDTRVVSETMAVGVDRIDTEEEYDDMTEALLIVFLCQMSSVLS